MRRSARLPHLPNGVSRDSPPLEAVRGLLVLSSRRDPSTKNRNYCCSFLLLGLFALAFEGVRSYTIFMSIEMKNPLAVARTHGEASALLDWIRQCPDPTDLRVFLFPLKNRQLPSLHRSLLALGCTVTVKLA